MHSRKMFFVILISYIFMTVLFLLLILDSNYAAQEIELAYKMIPGEIWHYKIKYDDESIIEAKNGITSEFNRRNKQLINFELELQEYIDGIDKNGNFKITVTIKDVSLKREFSGSVSILDLKEFKDKNFSIKVNSKGKLIEKEKWEDIMVLDIIDLTKFIECLYIVFPPEKLFRGKSWIEDNKYDINLENLELQLESDKTKYIFQQVEQKRDFYYANIDFKGVATYAKKEISVPGLVSMIPTFSTEARLKEGVIQQKGNVSVDLKTGRLIRMQCDQNSSSTMEVFGIFKDDTEPKKEKLVEISSVVKGQVKIEMIKRDKNHSADIH